MRDASCNKLSRTQSYRWFWPSSIIFVVLASNYLILFLYRVRMNIKCSCLNIGVRRSTIDKFWGWTSPAIVCCRHEESYLDYREYNLNIQKLAKYQHIADIGFLVGACWVRFLASKAASLNPKYLPPHLSQFELLLLLLLFFGFLFLGLFFLFRLRIFHLLRQLFGWRCGCRGGRRCGSRCGPGCGAGCGPGCGCGCGSAFLWCPLFGRFPSVSPHPWEQPFPLPPASPMSCCMPLASQPRNLPKSLSHLLSLAPGHFPRNEAHPSQISPRQGSFHMTGSEAAKRSSCLSIPQTPN